MPPQRHRAPSRGADLFVEAVVFHGGDAHLGRLDEDDGDEVLAEQQHDWVVEIVLQTDTQG